MHPKACSSFVVLAYGLRPSELGCLGLGLVNISALLQEQELCTVGYREDTVEQKVAEIANFTNRVTNPKGPGKYCIYLGLAGEPLS